MSVRLDAVAIQLCDALDERNELIADILIAAGRRGVSELDWTDLSRRWRLSVLDETTATLRGIHRLAGAALGA